MTRREDEEDQDESSIPERIEELRGRNQTAARPVRLIWVFALAMLAGLVVMAVAFGAWLL